LSHDRTSVVATASLPRPIGAPSIGHFDCCPLIRDPRLRTHKLAGCERWACGYAYDGRIVFTWEADVIRLLDVGTHDDVNCSPPFE
jgi:hypothetical protein